MFSRTLTLAAAVVAAASIAGTAQAAVIDTDAARITAAKYDFGGSAYAAGAPTGSGDLEFEFSGGKVRPRLTGTLHLNDADGTCARMQLRYFDKQGAELVDPKRGGTKCETDDQHHSYDVDLDPYSDDSIESVEVGLQKKTATGWSTVETRRLYVDERPDNVRITEQGADVGGHDFAAGAPAGSAQLAWNLEDGVFEPRLTGYLHLNNSAGLCARINLRYLTEGGSLLTREAGGDVCAGDNGHQRFSIDLSPYDSSRIGKVKVQLQTQGTNGSWNVAGSETVSIAE
jgi:hypothetical protein